MNKIYLIVGDGRLATHLRSYLTQRSLAVRQWSRQNNPESSFAELARGCDHILLCIKDDAVDEFIERHGALPEPEAAGKWVHFSGSLVSSHAPGLHPLMTFGQELYELRDYESIAFIGEKGRLRFSEVFPGLPNPSFEIDPSMKPLYHSLCVMSGNFTVLLWQKFFRELEEKLGVPSKAALPYLRQIARNLEKDPERALTGPLQRRDHATLARNQAALSGDPYQKIFESFVKAVLQ